MDHFLWTEGLHDHVVDGGVLHSPIYIKINVETITRNKEEVLTSKKISLAKSNDEEKEGFVKDLERGLAQLDTSSEAFDCRNINCENSEHTASLDIVTENILETINISAKNNLSTVGGKKKSSKTTLLPGWKEMVVPFQDRAEFWHFLWSEAGEPRQGTTFNLMKQTKGQYHYAVRRCKRAAHEINNDRYLEALLKGDIDIFEAVKKGRIQNRECATKVDGH